MKKLIVANWKMYLSPKDSAELFEMATKKNRVVICPSFVVLERLGALAKKSRVSLGAQDCFWENRGAYTGEVSPTDLKELGCEYVIVGHSERRNYLQETDEMIGKKVKAALAAGVTPILCVGENEAERKAGKAEVRVVEQLQKALAVAGLKKGQEIIIAYEPVWAIGTGKACAPEAAAEVHVLIKRQVAKLLGIKNIRVLYGGSVDANNVNSYLLHSVVDGILVGGASAKKDALASLLAAVAKF